MKNLYIKIVTNVCIFIFSCNYAYSQITTKEEPVSFSQKNLIWKDSIIVMPEFDLQALLLEEDETLMIEEKKDELEGVLAND